MSEIDLTSLGLGPSLTVSDPAKQARFDGALGAAGLATGTSTGLGFALGRVVATSVVAVGFIEGVVVGVADGSAASAMLGLKVG